MCEGGAGGRELTPHTQMRGGEIPFPPPPLSPPLDGGEPCEPKMGDTT